MSIQDFITQEVLGVPLKTANWMCEEFGLGIDRIDIKFALELCSRNEESPALFYNVGYCVITMLFGRLLADYGSVADRNDFELFYNGEETYMTYKGERIVGKEQLDKMTGVL